MPVREPLACPGVVDASDGERRVEATKLSMNRPNRRRARKLRAEAPFDQYPSASQESALAQTAACEKLSLLLAERLARAGGGDTESFPASRRGPRTRTSSRR